MDNGITSIGRINAVDALRGFAISAILLIHSSNHFLYFGKAQSSSEWLLRLDEILKSFLYFIFEGKAYSIFALLFGFTYALQLDKRMSKGMDMKYRMMWRMFLLALFGLFNAAFFPGGDPLIFYALCMIPIIFLRHAENKVLFWVGIFFLIQPLEWLNYAFHLFDDSYGVFYQSIGNTLKSGNFVETMKMNVTDGVKGCLLWALQEGRMSQTLGLFCIGMLTYRTGFFIRDVSFYKRITLYSLVLSVSLYIAMTTVGNIPLRMYYNLSSSVCMVNLLLWIYYKIQNVPFWYYMRIYGRMSLTNFIGQSVICTFLFHPWGLHLGVTVGTSLSILLAIMVLVAQIIFSRFWLNYHKQGPLEHLWHKLTWIKNS